MKYFVEWTYTDEYGRVFGTTGEYNWFDTEEEMEAWIARKIKGNGGYFHMFRKGLGKYENWERMLELWAKMKEMKEEVETLRAGIKLP